MTLLCRLVDLYVLVIFARIILSWFPLDPWSAMGRFRDLLARLTDPVMAPLRRVIPPVGGLDLSPIVLLLGISLIVRPLLGCTGGF